MTHASARHRSADTRRAVFKIDRVVFASVLAGLALAVLSSVAADEPPSAPVRQDRIATFP